MRLIDADSLMMNMDKGIQGTAREYLKFYQMAVIDEPTAYDVDKVVERLEERIENFKSLSPDDEIVDVAIKETQRNTEIVKSGGIE